MEKEKPVADIENIKQWGRTNGGSASGCDEGNMVGYTKEEVGNLTLREVVDIPFSFWSDSAWQDYVDQDVYFYCQRLDDVIDKAMSKIKDETGFYDIAILNAALAACLIKRTLDARVRKV